MVFFLQEKQEKEERRKVQAVAASINRKCIFATILMGRKVFILLLLMFGPFSAVLPAHFAQCWNFRIFLSFRFFVKSILENLEVLKLLFLQFYGLCTWFISSGKY